MSKIVIYLKEDARPLIEELPPDKIAYGPFAIILEVSDIVHKYVPYSSINYWYTENGKIVTPGGQLELV